MCIEYCQFINTLQESATLAEKYEFEVSTKEEVVRKLEIQYNRYGPKNCNNNRPSVPTRNLKFPLSTITIINRFLEVQCENDALRDTVDRLQTLMETNRDSHGKI